MPTIFFIIFKQTNLDTKLMHTTETTIASPFMNCYFFGLFGGFRFNMDYPTLLPALLCVKTNFIILAHNSCSLLGFLLNFEQLVVNSFGLVAG